MNNKQPRAVRDLVSLADSMAQAIDDFKSEDAAYYAKTLKALAKKLGCENLIMNGVELN
jgi:hypothetical protein